MKRAEARQAVDAIRAAWPAMTFGRGELDRWELDLAGHDLAAVLAAIERRLRATSAPPCSPADLVNARTRHPHCGSHDDQQIEQLTLGATA